MKIETEVEKDNNSLPKESTFLLFNERMDKIFTRNELVNIINNSDLKDREKQEIITKILL